MKPATSKRLTKQLLRQLRGPYSQRELADALKITAESYQEWELGKAQPNPENFRKLLDHYTRWMKHFSQDPQPVVDRMIQFLTDTDPQDQPAPDAGQEATP